MSDAIFRGVTSYRPWYVQSLIMKRLNKKIAKRNLLAFPQLAIFAFDNIGLQINLDGRYESDSLDALQRFLIQHLGVNRDSTVLDIGANIGNHSVFFSGVFRKVIAYEPNPRVFSILSFNCEGMNVKALNYALGNENTTLSFTIDPINLGHSKIMDEGLSPKASDPNIIEVHVRRLDDDPHVADESISLIKIDVEGHELQVLEGAVNLIGIARPIIVFEQSADGIHDGTSDTIDFLRKRKYQFFTIAECFELGQGLMARTASLLLRLILGFRQDIVATSHFKKRFYHMIIAVPK